VEDLDTKLVSDRDATRGGDRAKSGVRHEMKHHSSQPSNYRTSNDGSFTQEENTYLALHDESYHTVSRLDAAIRD
jgi:hypothetical protein